MKQRLAVLLLWFLVAGTAMAQEPESTPEPTPPINAAITSIVDAHFTVSNETPLLGEPFTVTLVVDMPAEAELETWPELEDDTYLEIIDTGEVEVETTETREIHRQTFQVVRWETGTYLSSELTVTYTLDGNRETVPVRSFYVFVPSLIPEMSAASLRPSMSPVDLPFLPRWVYIGGVAFAALGALGIARLIQTGKRDVVRVMAGSPAQIAIAQLEDMKLQQLPAIAVYPLVADSLRVYLQQQFGIDAPEMTTGEIGELLRDADLLNKDQRGGLHQLLEQADLVKFARFQPDNASGKRLINYAIKWLRESEQQSLVEVTLND